MPASDHHHRAGNTRATCAVLTVSDTRTEATDEGGKLIRDLLAAAGHTIVAHAIVKDDPAQIETQLRAWLADASIQVILTTGGTGIARRDTTIEVVARLLDQPLDGFGELFRMLSYPEIGPAAMLSRAVAGVADNPTGTLIFAMPGSVDAVRLALEKLILPELPHLVWERKR